MKISVTVRKNGFRRAGRPWTGTTIVKQKDFTKEQWKQLDDDPMFELVNLVDPKTTTTKNTGKVVKLNTDKPNTSSEETKPKEDQEQTTTDENVTQQKEPDPLIAQLVRAIGQLEVGNDDHWTKAKKPEITALAKITGVKDINAKMRDEAFAEFKATKDGGHAGNAGAVSSKKAAKA